MVDSRWADATAGSMPICSLLLAKKNPDSVWRALAPHPGEGALPIDQMERCIVHPGIAAASPYPTRMTTCVHTCEHDHAGDARRQSTLPSLDPS